MHKENYHRRRLENDKKERQLAESHSDVIAIPGFLERGVRTIEFALCVTHVDYNSLNRLVICTRNTVLKAFRRLMLIQTPQCHRKANLRSMAIQTIN